MMWDNEMRTDEKGPMMVMSSGLNAELGQIQYVLCDKTGTLTKNKMVFKHCSAGKHLRHAQDVHLVDALWRWRRDTVVG